MTVSHPSPRWTLTTSDKRSAYDNTLTGDELRRDGPFPNRWPLIGNRSDKQRREMVKAIIEAHPLP